MDTRLFSSQSLYSWLDIQPVCRVSTERSKPDSKNVSAHIALFRLMFDEPNSLKYTWSGCGPSRPSD